MKQMWVVLLLVGFPLASLGNAPSLKLVNEWKSIEFDFPSDRHRQEAIATRAFIPGNPVPLDVDVEYRVLGSDSRVFLTFPRFREGIPITLGTRSAKKANDGSNLIEPYPDYSWHANPTQNCDNRMVSVFRIAIDGCNRLWIVDTGKIGLAPSPQLCPPKILVFNLNNNQLIHRYQIPRDQYTQSSLFINPVIDVNDPGTCADTKAYIADVSSFAILVYDSATDSSWVTRNKLMFPYPSHGTHTISGESFDLMDGILGVAINENKNTADRMLYFHALASEVENFVPLNILNDRAAWQSDPNSYASEFKILGSRGTQSAASAIDSNGNLFFGLNTVNALACWDTAKRPLARAAIRTLVKDDEKLQFAGGMKVIRNTENEDELWIVTNRFQKVFTGTLNNNEINFRIQAQRVSELLSGTRCT